MRFIFALALTTFLSAALIPVATNANGLGGERLEKVVGDVIVDIGTDQTGTPLAGVPIEFDFNLLRSDTREPLATPTSVGLDIEHNGKPLVNGDLITELPNTFLFFTFPEAGTYMLKVTFFDSRRTPPQLATATFPLKISSAKGKSPYLVGAELLACAVAGLVAGYALARKRAAP